MLIVNDETNEKTYIVHVDNNLYGWKLGYKLT